MPGIQHADIDHSGLTGVGASAAADVSITDSGGYFTGTDVEAALQELGAGGGGGGGGLTQAYIGTNSIGGSSEVGTDHRQILQKVTLANACLISGIEVRIKNNNAGQVGDLLAFVYDDVSGKPQHLVAWGAGGETARGFNLYRVSATAGDARWLNTPIGYWAAAGDWWIGFQWTSQGGQYLQYYATGGSDYYFDKGGNSFVTDAPDTSGTVYTLTNSTKTYSIRANTIR